MWTHIELSCLVSPIGKEIGGSSVAPVPVGDIEQSVSSDGGLDE